MKINFDDYAEDYDELLKNQLNFFSKDDKYFARYKINIISDYIDFKPYKILEFGCGVGRNIPFLRDRFPESKLFGCDISNISLNIAKVNNQFANFFILDDLAMSHYTDSFDLIFIAGVFHHIHPDERLITLKRIKNLLSNNGFLFIFEHNPINPLTRKLVRECPFDANSVLLYQHELLVYLKECAFKVDKTGYCLFIPPKFSYLLKLEKYIRWLPLGGQYFVKAKKY